MLNIDKLIPACRSRVPSAARKSADERGSVLLEGLLSFILLIILFIGLVDISAMIMSSMVIEQAAREGARAASRIALLNPGVSSANRDKEGTPPGKIVADCNLVNRGGYSAEDCADVYIHSRVRHIIRRHARGDIDWTSGTGTVWGLNVENDVDITTEFLPTNWATLGLTGVNVEGDDAVALENTVRVRISAVYNGIFLRNFSIGAAFRAPHLF